MKARTSLTSSSPVTRGPNFTDSTFTTTAPAPPTASAADNSSQGFKPGTVLAYYVDDYAVFFPVDNLPNDDLEVCWTAQCTSNEEIQKKLNIALTVNH